MNGVRVLALTVAVLVSAGIGFGSRASYSPPRSDASILRLSWRLRGEKDEECRARTPEELAALPAHMRSPEICVGHLISYRMMLRIDDGQPVIRTFVPAGAKGDRPIFVMHEERLMPGDHEIDVSFAPQGEGEGEGEGEEDDEHHEHRSPLRFHSRIRVMPGEIVLLTLSDDATTLVQKR
jgi:hypothetical protein